MQRSAHGHAPPESKPSPCQVEVSPDKVLTIRAERKNDREEDGEQTRRVERQYGVFVRRFQARLCGVLVSVLS